MKGKKYPAEILTDEEVGRLIAQCSRRAPTGIRNRALLVVLYRAGLRIGEALALRPKDLDAAAGCIRILHGKGNKARTVGMDAAAFAFVERWLDVRKASGKAPLFCTLKGGTIHSAYIREWLPRIAAKAQIEKRVHAHALRHTHAGAACGRRCADQRDPEAARPRQRRDHGALHRSHLARRRHRHDRCAAMGRGWNCVRASAACYKDGRARRIGVGRSQSGSWQDG